jgi:uncharacterized membrane protein
MLYSARIATIFFAVALIGWGIIHFLVGDFIVGRAPAWPENVPGKIVWAYASGLLLIVTAAAIIYSTRSIEKETVAGRVGFPTRSIAGETMIGRVGSLTGLLILIWAGGRNLIHVVPNLDYGFMLTNLGKSITIGSGVLLMSIGDKKKWVFTFACICIGIFFLIGGIQHFIFIDFVKTLVPRWIPGDVFWSYVAAVGLIASGIALVTGVLRKLAALIASWMVFVWFLILHIPRGFGETASYNEWIAIFESLAVSAILATIYWREQQRS